MAYAVRATRRRRSAGTSTYVICFCGLEQLLTIYQVDMEKLADGLQKLNEDDLLEVVTMIHEAKAPDTWMKNDVDSEFNGAELSHLGS